MTDPEFTAPIEMNRFRDDYWSSLQLDRPFYSQRPAAFSPAAAAQEHYAESAIMWKFISQWIPWQYTDYHDESMSFHESAYLGDWSSLPKFRISGPDAVRFLSAYCGNSFRTFEVGQVKHSIQTNEEGKVVGEGVLYKRPDGSFRYTGGGAYWLNYWFLEGDWDAEAALDTPDEFVFAVQGPSSLAVMEALAGERLRDIGFSRCRPIEIRGHRMTLLRVGVSGELGYELHGPAEFANEIWSVAFETGKQFGLRQLGGRSQLVSHVEHGFPTIGRDFWPATSIRADKSRAHNLALSGGSYLWSDPRELMRSPVELGWGPSVNTSDHDFMGSDVIAREKAAGTAQVLMGLEWSSDDVIDVFASQFREGTLATPMEMPRTVVRHSLNPDQVLVGGKLVGCSTSRAYSTFLRRMISMCVLDREHAHEGRQVIVLWGDRDSDQREIRATVRALPFKPDNRRIDVNQL